MKNKIYIKILSIMLIAVLVPVLTFGTASAGPISAFFSAASAVAKSVVKIFSNDTHKEIKASAGIGSKLSAEDIKKALEKKAPLDFSKIDDDEKSILSQVSAGAAVGARAGSSESIVLKKKLDLLEKLYDEKFAGEAESLSGASASAAVGSKLPDAALNKTISGSALPAFDTTSVSAKAGSKATTDMFAKLKNQKANSAQFKELLNKFKEELNPQSKSYIEFATSSENSKLIIPPDFQVKGKSGIKLYEDKLEDKTFAKKSFNYDSNKKNSSAATPDSLQSELDKNKKKTDEQEQKKPSWKKPSISVDFYRNELTKTIGPQVKGGVEGSFNLGGATISGKASGEALVGVEAKGATYVGLRNGQLAAGVEGSVFAGARVRGSATAGIQMGQVSGQVFANAEGSAGAGANADVHAGIGKDGIEAVASGDAFVGVRGKVSAGGTIAHGNTSVTGTVSATGGIGLGAHFEAKGKISWTGIQAKVDLGAYLGIGGQLGFDVNVNFGDALKPVQKVVEKVCDAGKEVVSDVKNAISSAGKAIGNFFKW